MAGELQALAPEALEPEEGQTAIANCAMCGETLQGTQVRILQCSHIFHDTCYQGWKNHRGQSATCPTCRNDLSPPQRLETVTPLQSQDEFEASQESGSGSESGAIICPGCENCNFECESEMDTEGELCDRCSYHPTLDDAFSKWGHNDGGSCDQITDEVKMLIEELGYQVRADSWGSHNYIIMEIARGTEIVYPIDGYRIGGYDTRHYSAVLPDDILQVLEESEWNWN